MIALTGASSSTAASSRTVTEATTDVRGRAIVGGGVGRRARGMALAETTCARAVGTATAVMATMVETSARDALARRAAMTTASGERAVDASAYAFEFYAGVREMSEEDREWCFDVTRRNVREAYERAWGWDAVEKRRELNNHAARFILAREVRSGERAAFVHFRFEREDEEVDAPVGYVYELQCEPKHQRRALGETLVCVVEAVSKRLGMHAVVLTVLKVNVGAYAFYTKRMKYEIDDLSPDESLDEGSAHYLILSKRFV